MAGDGATPNASAREAALEELDLLQGEAFPDLDRLTALAADITGANISAFTVHYAGKAYQISTSYGAQETMAASDCLSSLTFEKGATAVLADCAADPKACRYQHVIQPPHVRSFAGAPVAIGDGPVIGVLGVGHTEPGKFAPTDVARLEKVAELVTAFLAQRRDAERARRAAAKTEIERQRQLQFEQIFDAIHEGINVYSLDGEIIESNPTAEEFLGVRRDTTIDAIVGDARWKFLQADGSPFPPGDLPINRVLKHGEMVRDVFVGVQPPHGDLRWLNVNGSPVFNPGTGKAEFGVVTFSDITRQHEAELKIIAQNAQLADALVEAEKGNKAKTDFMGVMSHELRTPMNAILSCVTLLQQSSLDPVQRRTLGVLQDAGRQMLALLNDLLDLSSLNADKVRISREPVQLVRLIEDAAVIWASEVKAKGLSLSVMIDPALIAPRDVDPARLLQIIGNLMANAIKFTSEGGITIQAWPGKGPGGVERVVIDVEDTGPGVPEEAAARIFSAFEQADASTTRKHGGLGLGLHVARRLALAMGGDIQLETRLGQGSRFTVRIDAPLSERAPSGADNENVADEAAARQVLCVDDNPRNLYVLVEILKAAGHLPTEVASGREALKLLGEKKFDVVLLDMVMPDMDGLDMLAELRSRSGVNQETPVIACTANVLPHQVEGYLSAGTAGVLAKPLNVGEVLKAVTSAA